MHANKKGKNNLELKTLYAAMVNNRGKCFTSKDCVN